MNSSRYMPSWSFPVNEARKHMFICSFNHLLVIDVYGGAKSLSLITGDGCNLDPPVIDQEVLG